MQASLRHPLHGFQTLLANAPNDEFCSCCRFDDKRPVKGRVFKGGATQQHHDMGCADVSQALIGGTFAVIFQLRQCEPLRRITSIPPVPVLLQRNGRLHRHCSYPETGIAGLIKQQSGKVHLPALVSLQSLKSIDRLQLPPVPRSHGLK